MKWIKKGFIFKAENQSPFMCIYASPVAALPLKNIIRIFFSSRSNLDKDGNYISYPTYIDVDKKDPTKILNINKKPIIALGKPGRFDENGILLAKYLIFNEKIYMYYMGWQRLSSKKTPYQVLLGLAISSDNGNTFKKVSEGPILGMDYHDPISIGNVDFLIKDSIIHMYYTSFSEWENNGIKATPSYNIKHATSSDGIFWQKDGKIIIAEDKNGGVATPSVFEYNGKYIMLFGYRKPYDENNLIGKYRIGYAESNDLINWTRDDSKAGIDVSESGWDSEMVCYPHVVKVDDKYLMFYCGNGFGQLGFGYAELEI